MKNYSLKMLGNQNDFFTIISQNKDGYNIKISRNINGKKTETLDFISKEVFDFSLNKVPCVFQLIIFQCKTRHTEKDGYLI